MIVSLNVAVMPRVMASRCTSGLVTEDPQARIQALWKLTDVEERMAAAMIVWRIRRVDINDQVSLAAGYPVIELVSLRHTNRAA